MIPPAPDPRPATEPSYGTVLLVEGDAAREASLGPSVAALGWKLLTVATVEEAAFALESVEPDAVLLASSKEDALFALRAAAPAIPLIVVAPRVTISSAILTMRRGAFDVLALPVAPDALAASFARALDVRQPFSDRRLPAVERHGVEPFIGDHGAIRAVTDLIARVARSSTTVLLVGETGTGKEVVARAIHARSTRANGPFIAVNCAAIPEGLLENELFGHEKGSFTGADSRTTGLVERANGGTLFLDEIGDLPLSLQPKLLRLLQEREIMRVGGESPIEVDARVVVATHRDLAALSRDGTFRDDLYWRLNVFPISLPALRDRASDIPLLANHFLQILARESEAPPKRISDAAMKVLQAHSWPGNVRELRSVMERAVLMSDGIEIEPAALAPPRAPPSAKAFQLPAEGFVLEKFERDLLVQALERSHDNATMAARLLGMSYRTLQYRLRKFRIRRG